MTAATKKILDDPSVRFFTKEIIRTALEKDILDAISDISLARQAMENEYLELIKQFKKGDVK